MKLLIDDANVEKIKELYELYAIDGVTTNPSILAKYGSKPYEVLKEIRRVIGKDELHVQVVSNTTETIIEEAKKIVATLGTNTYVKIPTTPEGLKAMKILHKEGYLITATAIYTPMQAYMAAKVGANYAAPYINRIDNLGANGVETARMIQHIFTSNKCKTEILAASFKNSNQVQELCEIGVGASTVAPEVIEGLLKNAYVTATVADFVRDFESICGKGKTMLDCDCEE